MQRHITNVFHSLTRPQAAPRAAESSGPSARKPDGDSRLTVRNLSLCSTAEARSCLPEDDAVKLCALPLGLMSVYGKEVLSLAVTDAKDRQIYQGLRFATGREIKLIEVPRHIIAEAVFLAYHRDGKTLKDKLEKLSLRESQSKDSSCGKKKSLPDFRSGSSESSQFLAALVDYAIAQEASDIHIIPHDDGSYIKLRINGEICNHDGAVCSLRSHQQMVTRIKVMSSLDTTARNGPQDGSFSIPLHGKPVHIRVSVMPTVHGDKVVMRLCGSSRILDLDSLGFDARTRNSLENFIKAPEGMVLFAGPTGSGKTTTMYSLMQRLSVGNLSLVSIEDPVEIELPFISQTSIDEKSGLNYATCLKSIVRQDPDVILLGEIRDSISAQAAFQAALTGHLLLSTVHARNVFEVLLRLSSFGMDNLTIAQALNLVVCQTLVPKLCEKCKVFDLMASNRWHEEIYKAVGCAACDYTGFSGRVLAAESLSLDESISNRIIEHGLNTPILRKACSETNYSSLEEAYNKMMLLGIVASR